MDYKKNLSGCLAFLCLSLAVFTACGSDDDEIAPNTKPNGEQTEEKEERIILQSLDVAKAKCLSMAEAGSSRSESNLGGIESTLFKVDENGNVSAVAVTYTAEDVETGVKETRRDLRVVPRMMGTLEGKYTILNGCQLWFENGEQCDYDVMQHLDPDATNSQLNLLVRNSDGKIFYVPYDTFYACFWRLLNYPSNVVTAVDHQGEVFITGEDGVIRKITTQNAQLVIKQVTPSDLCAANGDNELWPMNNGTLIVAPKNSRGNYTLYYPNGSFEDFQAGDFPDDYVNFERVSLSLFPVNNRESLIGVEVTNGLMAGQNSDQCTLALYRCDFGTAYGSLRRGSTLMKETKTIDYENWAFYYAPSTLIESDKYYLCDRDYVIEKSNYNVLNLNQQQREHLPSIVKKEMIYKNRLWTVENNGSRWLDLNTLEYGDVQFNDIDGRFRVKSCVTDFATGTHYIYGVDYTDGGNVICATDIETGRCTITHTPDNRTVTALVPLN